MKESKDTSDKEEDKSASNPMKNYSLAYNTIGPVVIGVVVGQLLDRYLKYDFPIFTIVLSGLMIIVSLYQLFKLTKS